MRKHFKISEGGLLETMQKLSLQWLEDELKKIFKKEQITSDDLEQIKYFSMREDGDLIIEISLEEPPVPFSTPWGGDEWEKWEKWKFLNLWKRVLKVRKVSINCPI
ncbi:MAG: hypothetical protein K2K20_05155 [Lachnospiraceae bacterium]|nr:hypothetical protein [Lachnospiraceae bacterium]